MNNTSSRSRVVIVAAVDQTAASEHVSHSATALASVIAGAEVHFVHVIDLPVMVEGPYVSPLPELRREARAFLDGVKDDASARFGGKLATHIGVGAPARIILQLASDIEADVVIVGSHGRNALERAFQGSVSRYVVAHASCAVLVARPKAYAAVPEIEPACPECLEVQKTTHGDELWCARHAQRHAHGHLHYESPEGFGAGSMFLRP